MKPERNPWMKFYPADWRADAMLRLCSIAARGLWAEMMCLMHEAERYGSLLVNGKRIDKRQLAGLAGISEKDCSALLLELEGNGVFSRDDDGTIYSRRMRRDFEKAVRDKANGKVGGNPKLKGGVNPQGNGEDKAQKPEARSQKDSDADASGAAAPIDHRKRLFDEGLAKLGVLTGKGTDACRSFVGKCLKAAGDDAIIVLGLIEEAERNRVVDPSAWISARLKGPQNGSNREVSSACDRLISVLDAGFGGVPPQERLGGGAHQTDVGLLPYRRS